MNDDLPDVNMPDLEIPPPGKAAPGKTAKPEGSGDETPAEEVIFDPCRVTRSQKRSSKKATGDFSGNE